MLLIIYNTSDTSIHPGMPCKCEQTKRQNPSGSQGHQRCTFEGKMQFLCSKFSEQKISQ